MFGAVRVLLIEDEKRFDEGVTVKERLYLSYKRKKVGGRWVTVITCPSHSDVV